MKWPGWSCWMRSEYHPEAIDRRPGDGASERSEHARRAKRRQPGRCADRDLHREARVDLGSGDVRHRRSLPGSAARLSARPLASTAPRPGRRERQPHLPRPSPLDSAHVSFSARVAAGCVARPVNSGVYATSFWTERMTGTREYGAGEATECRPAGWLACPTGAETRGPSRRISMRAPRASSRCWSLRPWQVSMAAARVTPPGKAGAAATKPPAAAAPAAETTLPVAPAPAEVMAPAAAAARRAGPPPREGAPGRAAWRGAAPRAVGAARPRPAAPAASPRREAQVAPGRAGGAGAGGAKGGGGAGGAKGGAGGTSGKGGAGGLPGRRRGRQRRQPGAAGGPPSRSPRRAAPGTWSGPTSSTSTARPSASNWGYESGFVRNEELQWYQPDNATVANGMLTIAAQKVHVANPNYVAGSSDWKTQPPVLRLHLDVDDHLGQAHVSTAASRCARGSTSARGAGRRSGSSAASGAWPAGRRGRHHGVLRQQGAGERLHADGQQLRLGQHQPVARLAGRAPGPTSSTSGRWSGTPPRSTSTSTTSW